MQAAKRLTSVSRRPAGAYLLANKTRFSLRSVRITPKFPLPHAGCRRFEIVCEFKPQTGWKYANKSRKSENVCNFPGFSVLYVRECLSVRRFRELFIWNSRSELHDVAPGPDGYRPSDPPTPLSLFVVSLKRHNRSFSIFVLNFIETFLHDYPTITLFLKGTRSDSVPQPEPCLHWKHAVSEELSTHLQRFMLFPLRFVLRKQIWPWVRVWIQKDLNTPLFLMIFHQKKSWLRFLFVWNKRIPSCYYIYPSEDDVDHKHYHANILICIVFAGYITLKKYTVNQNSKN